MSGNYDETGDWAKVWPIDYRDGTATDLNIVEKVIYSILAVILVVGTISIAFRVVEFLAMILVTGGVW